MVNLTDVHFDTFLELGKQVIDTSPRALEDFLALVCTTPSFYYWAQENDAIWKKLHNHVFGEPPEVCKGVSEQGQFTWRALVLRRYRGIQDPVVKAGTWLIENYEPNLSVQYSLPRLGQACLDERIINPHARGQRIIADAMFTLTSFWTEQLRERTANPGDYFPARLRFFYLAASGNGPRDRHCYYALSRKGALPAPFPRQAVPTAVFTVTIAPLTVQSTQAQAWRYFNGMMKHIHLGLKRLVHTTCQASISDHPDDPTNTKALPLIRHMLLPTVPGPLAPPLDIPATLQEIPWGSQYYVHKIFNGRALLRALGAAKPGDRLCILMFHSGGDPFLSPLAWVPHTTQLDENCTVAYAFTAEQAFREGFDMTTFGRDHLDYMIAAPLRALRTCHAWYIARGISILESVGVDVMVHDAQLSLDDAVRIHEMLTRMGITRGKGARAIRWRTRVAGLALP
ncbi:hypothetical protein BD309DRAFT_1082451 [Dichomitus squalens]|uniref:Uncharacterized protein n=1 Tax=Dichomitus squalens TaxID=114155 RepID=A0A4Q9MCR2_9APHY|nr:hypothetical protein BD311DRAFT_868314 [Dichomitus squalens]TBU40862.1 hypothetical protein BD309DRAFT_1082451 [Dichomitus squalens]TBU56798.1 hypothetical protein BD310DRAFT_1040297 [Dichomitus squalens]